MPSLTLTPTTVAPGQNFRIDGAGFDPKKKVQLAYNGVGYTTNILRPAKDGTFHFGMTADSTVGVDKVTARYNGSTTVVATASITVQAAPPPPPVDPVPTITSGPTVTPTADGATITWSLSEPCTGQVEFGPTSAYGQFSTLEPSLLTTHIQSLTGLAGTYHFRVRSKDSAGQEVVSADGTFTTTTPPPPPPPPPPSGTYPPDRAFAKTPTRAAPPLPGYLTEFTDPDYGTKVRRISNTDQVKNEYARIQAWSKDGLYIALMWDGGRRLLDGTTYADIGRVPDGTGNQAWSNVQPHRMYGVTGHTNEILQWEPGQAGWTVIGTVPNAGSLYLGNYEGGLSLLDTGVLQDGSQLILYDFANRKELGRRPWPAGGDMSDTSPSGKYIVADDGSRAVLLDATDPTLKTIRLLVSSQGGAQRFGHQDLGRDAAGNDVVVYVNPNGNGVNCQRLDTGEDHSVLGGTLGDGGITGVCHVCCTSYDRPGWCVITSNSNYTGAAGWDQIFAAKLDGSGVVEVFARMHNENPATHQQYDKSPHGTASRDLLHVLYGSVNSDSAASPTYCYVAGMDT